MIFLLSSVNFIHWNFLMSIKYYSTMEMKNILQPLSSIVNPIEFLNPRCIYQSDPATIHLFGREFYGKSMKTAIDDKLRTMITNVRKSLETQTAKSDWLSVEAKRAIKRKLHGMKYRIGYPEWYDDETSLIGYYEGMTIGDSYFENVFSLERTYKKRNMESWGRSTKYEISGDSELVINAGYTLEDNSLRLPVVLFQPPLFRGSLPKYVEYGSIGHAIAHEMGHAIGPAGVQYDFEQNKPLIEHNMNATLFERVHCFVDMGNEYSMGTGESALEETIADWNGRLASFDSYREMRKTKYPSGELKLPKFDAFTDEQMFFISSAQAFCAASNEQGEDTNYIPNNLRVIEIFSNIVTFAEAFNCPKNSSMNPERKCNMWMEPSIAP